MIRSTGSLRIGDSDRDLAIEVLAQHFADGRLTQAEYEERMEAALRARTQSDLAGLFRDLPQLGPVAREGPVRRRPAWYLPAVVLMLFVLLLPITAYMLFHAIGVALVAFWVIARGASCSGRRTASRYVGRGPRRISGRGGWPPNVGYGGRF
jgi:DUF1707 SHOCT-like domain